MHLRFLLTILVQVAFLMTAIAQPAETDFLRSTGKIYVVVAVILALFLGIVYFLYRLDRKLTRLEHQMNQDD